MKSRKRYGYVNRALPEAELDGFVGTLAQRIDSCDRRAIAAAKNLVNENRWPEGLGTLVETQSPRGDPQLHRAGKSTLPNPNGS